MKLELILSDDRKIIYDFAGDMQAAYDQYSAKPFLLDGVEAIVCRLHYIPDPIDFQAKNVTACFTTELGMSTIICDKFAMHLAPYCQDQTGHEIVCEMVNGQRITHSWLYKPDVLLIMGSVAIPSSIIHEDITGREQKRDTDVLCYQIRQAFKPGE